MVSNWTGNSSFDVAKWIQDHLGYQTSENALMYTILYGILFVLGICGNISTVIVVFLSRRKQGWTGIDLYLLNLAFTDILLSITGIPIEIYKYWQQYPWVFGSITCSGIALLSEASLCSSILTIVAFTFERFLAVRDPIKTFQSFSPKRTSIVISAIWLLSMINAVPYAHFTSVNHLHDPANAIIFEASWCAIHYTINAQVAPLFIYSFFAFYILPMVILALLYIRIGMLLRRNLPQRRRDLSLMDQKFCVSLSNGSRSGTMTGRHESREAVDNRKRSVKVLLAIVLNFFLCYGLFHVQRLIFALVKKWDEQSEAVRTWNAILFPISGFLYHANPVLDPIFYSMISKRFGLFYLRLFRCDYFRQNDGSLPGAVHQTHQNQSSNCKFNRLSNHQSLLMTDSNNKGHKQPSNRKPTTAMQKINEPNFVDVLPNEINSRVIIL